MRPLPARFYERDALDVARDLIGKLIIRGEVTLRITECEAYRWPDDTASHCRAGRTVRNAPMWGPPGHAYVYLCYGIHRMLNFVTGRVNEGAAVLIRSCEVRDGHDVVRERRRTYAIDAALARGPGCVGVALDLSLALSGVRLDDPTGAIGVFDDRSPVRLARGPRVGVDFASPRDVRARYRFADRDSRAVTVRSTLRPA